MINHRSNQEITTEIFHTFLLRHNVKLETISEDSLSLGQIITSASRIPQLTKFKALDDTLLYSNLLVTLFRIVPSSHINTLIDFGAGSSIPTIKALLSLHSDSMVKVIAVDNDPEAIEVSKRNVDAFGLSDHYTYVFKDMFSFLSDWKIGAGQVLASNPPYAPVPSDLKDEFYHHADGGLDGTKYIGPLLKRPMPKGTIIALRWCSLDNPCKIIPLIEDNYEILHIEAHKSSMGAYTGSEQLRNHLEGHHKSGLSYFTIDKSGQRDFISVGCIIRKR